MAEALGTKVPVSDSALPPSLAEEHAGPDSESKGSQEYLARDDPVLTFGVSLGGDDERMLYYYAGQVRNTSTTTSMLQKLTRERRSV